MGELWSSQFRCVSDRMLIPLRATSCRLREWPRRNARRLGFNQRDCHRRLQVARNERRVPHRVVLATAMTLVAIPYGKRRPIGTPFTWGEAMLGSVYAFGTCCSSRSASCPTSGSITPTRNSGGAPRIVYGPGGSSSRSRPEPTADGTRSRSSTRRRRPSSSHHPRLLLRTADLHLDVVAEARPDAPTEVETTTYGRPLVKKA